MKKICVIFGGASSEHDISIITGLQLYKNISLRYDIKMIYFGLDNHFYLSTKSDATYYSDKKKIKLPEIIFYNGAVYKKRFFKKLFDVDLIINCCHGGVGENGDLSAFFEVHNIRYTNSNPLSSHIAMNKSLAKSLLKDELNVVEGILVTKENKNLAIEEIKNNLSDDLIVKPNSLGSSIGVKACNKENFTEQIEAIFEMQDDALVENRVTNMIELNQACVSTKDGLILSAIEQPLSNHGFLTFEDKYLGGKTKGKDRIIPAKIDKKLKEKIDETTKHIYKKLNYSGIVRIDYIYDLDNFTLYFNEANTIPGSMAFYLFEPIGIDYISLIDLLINNEKQTKKYLYFNTDILNKTSF